MNKPSDMFAQSKPRINDPVSYQGEIVGVVSSVDDELCWVRNDNGSAPFIWCFRDGLNKLHSWPTKGTNNA